MHQATAAVGLATANLLPQTEPDGLDRLRVADRRRPVRGGTAAWSAGGSLLQPSFHGGELRYKRRAAVADLEHAAAQYRQTVWPQCRTLRTPCGRWSPMRASCVHRCR